MLTKVEIENPNFQLTSNPPKPYYDIYYRGSARGYSKSGIENFKDICEQTGLVEYAQGHQNAFGISIKKEYIEEFLQKTDIALANMESEPLYYVDYIFKGVDVIPSTILEIADLNDI
jgi:single-stranded-DNA-specific exonuclease